MGAHLIEGQFQSDKYPTTPRGKVPLSVNDPAAQDLLWQYAQRHRATDAEFSDDLEFALRKEGYVPAPEADSRWRHRKRGTFYHLVGIARVQSLTESHEGDQMVIYRAEADHSLWARPVAEFHDGRFERIMPAHEQPRAEDQEILECDKCHKRVPESQGAHGDGVFWCDDCCAEHGSV